MAVLQSDTGVVLPFRGRFRFGIDHWAYVPFDVPTGIRRIEVSTSHDRFSLLGIGRNVLDLDIFGPAGHSLGNADGFRGWSGGAREGFTLTATHATPGYLAGPIDPGQWVLTLGPVVLNPIGMEWQAQVVLTPGVERSLRPSAPSAAAARPHRGAGWFRGDLHTHTVHSDGRRQITEMAEAATTADLDFIVSTDHNTNSANRAWAATPHQSLAVVTGEEVTTRHGHWLAVGLGPGGWVDWRYGPRDGVWNGPWNVDDELSLRIWHQLLRQGRRIVGVGGSDSHVSDQPVGPPQTVVYAQDLSTPALVGGLRRGRCYVAESSAVTLTLNALGDDGCMSAGPGQALILRAGASVAVTTEVTGAEDCNLAIVTDVGCVARARTDSYGFGKLTWMCSAGDAKFARIEVRRRSRFPSIVALSNPVWLDTTG